MIKRRSIVFLIFVSIVILLSSWDGLYYQTESDTVFPSYIFGYYSSGVNALPITFGCFSYLGSLMNFVFVFKEMDTILYDGFQIVLVILSISSCFYILFVKQFEFSTLNVILVLVFSILFFDFFRPFEFSKTSFIVTFLGLLLYYDNKKKPISYILITLGFLIRPEPATIVFIIYIFYYSFIKTKDFNLNTIYQTFKCHFPLLVLFLVMSLSINIPLSNEDAYYKKIRPYEYSLSDFDIKDFNTKYLKEESSIKIFAAKNFFYADSSKINVAFFNENSIIPRDKTPFSILISLANFSDFFFKNTYALNFIKNVSAYLIFGALMILFFLYFKDFRFIIFILSCTALNMFLVFYFKPEFHFITPIFCITFLLCFQKFHHHILILNKIEKVGVLLLMVGFGSIQVFAFQKELLDDSKRKHSFYSRILEHVEKNPSKNIMLNISVWDNFHWKLFGKIKPINHDEVFVVDGGILYISADYQNKMRQITNETTFEKQFLKISSKEKLQIYTSKKRMRLLLDYMSLVYGVNIDIKPVKCFGYFENSDDSNAIFLYEIV